MIIPEDGCLPRITRSGLAPFSNVMIIKVPEQFRRPGETVYQLATLDRSKKTERWPADKHIDALISAEGSNTPEEVEANSDEQNKIEEPSVKVNIRERMIHMKKKKTNIDRNTKESQKKQLNSTNSSTELIHKRKRPIDEIETWLPGAAPLMASDSFPAYNDCYRDNFIRPHNNDNFIRPHNDDNFIRPQNNDNFIRPQNNDNFIRPQNNNFIGPQNNDNFIGPQNNDNFIRPQHNNFIRPKNNGKGLLGDRPLLNPTYNVQNDNFFYTNDSQNILRNNSYDNAPEIFPSTFNNRHSLTDFPDNAVNDQYDTNYLEPHKKRHSLSPQREFSSLRRSGPSTTFNNYDAHKSKDEFLNPPLDAHRVLDLNFNKYQNGPSHHNFGSPNCPTTFPKSKQNYPSNHNFYRTNRNHPSHTDIIDTHQINPLNVPFNTNTDNNYGPDNSNNIGYNDIPINISSSFDSYDNRHGNEPIGEPKEHYNNSSYDDRAFNDPYPLNYSGIPQNNTRYGGDYSEYDQNKAWDSHNPNLKPKSTYPNKFFQEGHNPRYGRNKKTNFGRRNCFGRGNSFLDNNRRKDNNNKDRRNNRFQKKESRGSPEKRSQKKY